MLEVIPSFYAKYSRNNNFISAKTHKKYLVGEINELSTTMLRCAFYPIADITFSC